MTGVVATLKRVFGDANLAFVYVNMAMYALCFQMQRPMQPELVKSLNQQDQLAFANLQSVTGIAQFFGGLASGPLMDKCSPRLLFLLSFLASMISYILVVTATDVNGLYLSAVPTVLQQAMMAGRTYVSRRAHPDECAALIAYLMSAYGIGAVLGPYLGGKITAMYDGDVKAAAWFAAVGSGVSCGLVLAFLRDDGSESAERAADKSKDGKPQPGFSMGKLFTALRDPRLLSLLTLKTVAAFATALVSGFGPYLMTDYLGMSVQDKGFAMSVLGTTAMLCAPLLSFVKPYFRDRYLCAAVCLNVGVLYLLLPVVATTMYGMLSLLSVTTLLSFVFVNVNAAQLSAAVPHQFTGSVVALDMSIGTGVRIFAPRVVVYLKDDVGAHAVSQVASALLLIVGLGFLFWVSDAKKKFE